MEWELLGKLPDEEREAVLSAARRRRFGRNDVLFGEGEPGDSLHLIAEGHVAVRVTTPQGDVATVRVIGPGNHVGELALVSPAPRNATVVALDATETLSLPRTAFDDLRRRHPDIELLLVDSLTTEVRRLATLMTEAMYLPVGPRVLRRLLDLAEMYAGDGDGDGDDGDGDDGDLGTGNTATAIGAGDSFTCALLGIGQIKCWGRNNTGQLGQGDQVARGSSPESMGDGLPPVPLGGIRSATSLAVGNSHVCTILDNQDLKCWGYNVDGQLGVGDTANRGDAADELGTNLPAVSVLPRPVAVTAGDLHTCALLDSEQIRCWGANLWGQLGIGDTDRRGDGPNEMGFALPAVGLLPANDDFADAEVLAGARGTRTGVDANAALEPLEPYHADTPYFQTSIWYSWQAATAGRTRFVATRTRPDNRAVVLAVYTGSEVDALTEVAADFSSLGPAEATFHAEAGQTYRVVVAGVYASSTGRLQLTWASAAPCDGQPVTVALAFGDTSAAGADVIRGTAGADTHIGWEVRTSIP